MSDINLSEKFPDMRPIKGPPSLSTLNGVGMMMIGSRDFDEETSSHVKTYVFSVLFIPLVNIGAYRVINAQNGGWYFLGKVPLSKPARIWNFSILFLILAAVGYGIWHEHVNSPDYLAERRLEQADQLAADGKTRQAAEIYRDEMLKPSRQSATAQNKLRALIETPKGSLEETAGVYRIAIELQRQNRALAPDLFERGMKLAEDRCDDDPRGALALLEIVAPLSPQPKAALATRRKILERLVAADPQDVDLSSRLAVVCEQQGDTARCEALLKPHAGRLGDRDGAAVLGRILAAKGDHEGARRLLQPFVNARLPKLKAAEKNCANLEKSVQEQVFQQLKQGNVPDFNYAECRRLPDDQQQALVQQYISRRMNENPGIRAAQQALAEQSHVLTAALELGMAILQTAQGRADPSQRRRELEEAEKMFLDIRGLAGEADVYRINLGQVYYWLGKHAEGRKEFEELLKAKKRDHALLLAVSNILREVGDVSEARLLAEEAYNNQTQPAKRHEAAEQRSLMFKDNDDRILWLSRADTSSVSVKAGLSNARGIKCVADGKDDEAATHFREAIEAYSQMPENAASLNNSALVHFALYNVTHEREQLVRGTAKLDRAVALQPGDSILLSNASAHIFDEAVRDVVGDRIDLKLLKWRWAGPDLFAFLYQDEAGRQALIEQFRKNPGTIKSRQYLEKLLILAPKRENAYAYLTAIHKTTRDKEALRGVWQRLQPIDLDQKQERQDVLDFYAGKEEPRKAEDARKAVSRAEQVFPEARKAGGATFAVAVNHLIRVRTEAAKYGDTLDEDALVKFAEEADKAAPSQGSRSALADAVQLRAHRALIREDGAYAELAKKTARSLGSLLLNYVLAGDGSLRDKALANPDVKRLSDLNLESWRKWPEDAVATSWPALAAAHPQEANAMAQSIVKDPHADVEASLRQKLSPLDGSTALKGYLRLRLASKIPQANDLLQKAAAQGIPLPNPTGP